VLRLSVPVLAARHCGDVSDWPALTGVFEIRRPVNIPSTAEQRSREKCHSSESTRVKIVRFWIVFGQLLIKRFALCYRTVVCLSCP